jgi:hypothetical protein
MRTDQKSLAATQYINDGGEGIGGEWMGGGNAGSRRRLRLRRNDRRTDSGFLPQSSQAANSMLLIFMLLTYRRFLFR